MEACHNAATSQPESQCREGRLKYVCELQGVHQVWLVNRDCRGATPPRNFEKNEIPE
jgi:hypothetical protein